MLRTSRAALSFSVFESFMKQNSFGFLISVLIIGVALARAENSSVAPNHTTPAALIQQALTNNPELKFYAA